MNGAPDKQRLPPWLKKRVRVSDSGAAAGSHAVLADKTVSSIVADLGLCTVCTSAHCPNIGECFARRTATFMILGDRCTRDCRFCAVRHGQPEPPRQDEPQAVAAAAEQMNLSHVVITSVTRDDLPDGGAGHFARSIRAVHERLPHAAVEVLVPDFRGRRASVETVLDARPEVFGHNIETVPRLYPTVRPEPQTRASLPTLRAEYARNLQVLAWAAEQGMCTKSGLMLGLGETAEEVLQALRDLRAARCQVLTLGQYLSPSPEHVPVARFVPPAEFEQWRQEGISLGFAAVAAGPFVRSSYHAAETYAQTKEHMGRRDAESAEDGSKRAEEADKL